MRSEVTIYQCKATNDIADSVATELKRRENSLPTHKDALIFLKPNLNSDMNALTGNTTDLRIITSVLRFFREKGYTNLVIADGTSSGFYRNEINVISRLRVDKIARRFGASVLDLNHSPYREVDFGDGFNVKIADICLKNDYFINLPKLKMHFEQRMSAALKNLMGCVVGLEKQKVHKSLARNILRLNEKIKPSIHIVDGLIVMEGTGPSAGDPAYLGYLVVGSDPYQVDTTCAELLGWEIADIPYLRLAREKELVDYEEAQKSQTNQSVRPSRAFERPSKNLLVAIAYHPKLRNYLTAFRLSPVGEPIFSFNIVSDLLLKLGLRQDVFVPEDGIIERITLDARRCNRCGICGEFCPAEIDLPDGLSGKAEECVKCLYCFFVCPTKAIGFDGEPGFILRQIERYDKPILDMIRGAYQRR